MSGAWTIARREVYAHAHSRAAWIAAALFVLVLHALFFFLGHPIAGLSLPSLWEGGEASLRALFAWLPLLLALLAPAFCMSAWARERGSGTEELLLSFPVRVSALVAGKFLAAWSVLALLLVVAVLPPALSVATLGPLDWGATLAGLGGAVCLAGSFAAIALACSAATHEELLAFAFGATILGALWSGALFVRVLPPDAARVVGELTPHAHFLETAAIGVLDLRDLVYHGSLAGLGLAATALLVEGRRWR